MFSEVLVVAHRDRLPRLECRGGIAARSRLPTRYIYSLRWRHRLAATPSTCVSSSSRGPVSYYAACQRRWCCPAATPRRRTPPSTWRWRGASTSIWSRRSWLPTRDTCPSSRCTSVTPAGFGFDNECRSADAMNRGRAFGAIPCAQWHAAGRCCRVEMGAGALAADVTLTPPRAYVGELRYPAKVVDRPLHATARVFDLPAGGVLTTWQGDRLP
jgi:urease accessory protein